MASKLNVCGVCDYRHITKPSVVWCLECDEGLCEECKEHHGISKGTRSHGTLSIAEYKKLPFKVLQVAQSCNKHNQKYQLFCKKHDCPCCKKCIVETHNDCKELTDIDDISRHTKSSNAYADIKQSLSDVAANVKRLRSHREDNLTSLYKKSLEVQKEVQETRSRINQHLDYLQDAFLYELKIKEQEESIKIRQLLKSLIDKEKEITEHQKNIVNIKQYASERQTFLALKHLEKAVAFDEQYIQSMVNSDSANQVDLSCNINTSLHSTISAIQKFGEVDVVADSCDIQIQTMKARQAQMMIPVSPMSIYSLKPKLLETFYTQLGSITGCTLLPDSSMLFACNSSQILQVLKPDGSIKFDIPYIDRVFDLTLIDDNSVALTSGYKKDSRQIYLIDIKSQIVKKKLQVESVNSGLAYSEDNLIYCAGKDGIQMINLNNESILNLTKTKLNVFSYVATFGDKIFYSNVNENSVTCIDLQGNLQWVFIEPSVLHYPCGISVDRYGNVFVVGGDTNNVVVISPNGKNYRELLTSENGLCRPTTVHVNRSICQMLVANRTGKGIVYSLKHKTYFK